MILSLTAAFAEAGMSWMVLGGAAVAVLTYMVTKVVVKRKGGCELLYIIRASLAEY